MMALLCLHRERVLGRLHGVTIMAFPEKASVLATRAAPIGGHTNLDRMFLFPILTF